MANYQPTTPPIDPKALGMFLEQELRAIAEAFAAVENVQLQQLHVEPKKLIEGMIVLADGTNWNPGSGRGFYGYTNGAWVFLG